jgi:HAD superfamily hydrolase (TIGR01490 family)
VALALFDFDGTISFRDSFAGFIRYLVGPARYRLGVLCLLPVVAGFLFGFIRSWRAKELMSIYFFGGLNVKELTETASRYSLEELPKIVRKEMDHLLEWHKERGDTVVVVSASIDLWLRDWCRSRGIGLIATELEVKEGRVTGRFLTRNCSGKEKVKRIEKELDLSCFDHIYAYGDSPGDRAMLRLAHEAYYRGKRLNP